MSNDASAEIRISEPAVAIFRWMSANDAWRVHPELCESFNALLTAHDGLRNDALSLTLQRDQALRECERLREQVNTLTADCRQYSQHLTAVTAERDAFTAALAEVRGEMPEVDDIRNTYEDGPATHDEISVLLTSIDHLMRHEAANRNAIRLAQETIAGLKQYHDWAEPQVQRLGREIVARESAEARARELEEAINRALVCLMPRPWSEKKNPSLACELLQSALSPPPPADEGLQAEHPDKARLDWIDSECADLRCQVHQYHDDSDTYYQVITFHQDKPKERVVGEGKSSREAIDSAMTGITQAEAEAACASMLAGELCEDCPPNGYPTDDTRCEVCPRRTVLGPPSPAIVGAARVADKRRIAELQKALQDIAEMTNADDPDSYRCDDREGCFDAVFGTATQALATTPSKQE